MELCWSGTCMYVRRLRAGQLDRIGSQTGEESVVGPEIKTPVCGCASSPTVHVLRSSPWSCGIDAEGCTCQMTSAQRFMSSDDSYAGDTNAVQVAREAVQGHEGRTTRSQSNSSINCSFARRTRWPANLRYSSKMLARFHPCSLLNTPTTVPVR